MNLTLGIAKPETVTEEPTEFGTLVTAHTIFAQWDTPRRTFVLAYNQADSEVSWINELGEFWAWDELTEIELKAPF